MGNSHLIGIRISTETSVTEEPREGKLHVGICAGGCRVTGIPTVPVFIAKTLFVATPFSTLGGEPRLGLSDRCVAR